MSVDWVGQRVYSPSLDEVKYGATTPSTNNDHYYIQRSRYPLKGGFWSYTHSLAQGLNLHLGHKAAEIDLHRKRISFHDGGTEDYQHLISSIPLPELVRIIKDAPSAVDEAASQLSCSSIVIVNIGLRGELPHRYHWMYFYDDDILFSRVAFPHMFSPNNAPQGHSSIQAEVYFSHYRPLPAENILERVITDLGKTGIIHDAADIVFAEEELVEYGNVIFDHHRSRNVAIIREFLEENGVLTCGRYGEWAYLWTDQAVISGEKAAKQLGLELAE